MIKTQQVNLIIIAGLPYNIIRQRQCSEKLRKFHRKTPVLESPFNKEAFNKQRCFPVKFTKKIKNT